MFQYPEHQGCWSDLWEMHSNSNPVDESPRKKRQPLRRYWGSKDAPKATIPLGPGNPFWRMMFNRGISEAWCNYMWYDSPKSHEYKLLKHAAVCSLTPDLMAFVASCIILFHPQKLKPTGTSCLLCRPSTLTPHATWQKKGQVSTQIWRQEKHMRSNWPKSSLYCPFWLQTRQQQLSVFHGSLQKVTPQITTVLGQWPPNHPPHLLPSSGEASAMGTTSSFLNDVHPEK